MEHRRWKILPPAPAAYQAELGLPPVAAQLLYNRGIVGRTEAEAFLSKERGPLEDPFLIPDMSKAVARTYQALLRGETIAVYGDFDADGICGTAVLAEGLARLGGKVIPYIPHRVQEGYGLNNISLDSLLRQGAGLVITVDCGISDLAEVDYAREIGLDVIVTDHHTISRDLPNALAVVNPKRADSIYPNSQLAGVGVAFKLLQALYRNLGKEDEVGDLLDLVSVGTVADMVPLLGENRSIVIKGLAALANTNRIGLQELLRAAGMSGREVDSQCISWTVAPRLNAPGRLEHAVAGYRLLMTNSLEEARQLATELEETNSERQRLTAEYLAKAREQVLATGPDAPLLMAGGEGYPPGVAGLIAGRLVEEFYRPSLVFEKGEEKCKGSGRSIAEFNLVKALMECDDLLLRYGGHPMAAGFSVQNDRVDELRTRLVEIARSQLADLDLRPFVTIEAEVPLSAVNSQVLKIVQRLAPFGNSNPVPVFLSHKVQVVQSGSVGDGSKHLRLKLKQGGVVWKAIGFDLGHMLDQIDSELDVVYSLSVDRWGGTEMMELNVLDFAPAS